MLSNSGELVEADAISFARNSTIFQKSAEVRKSLKEIRAKYNITSTFIEENLQAFRPGFSSAKTIVTLARFNGIVTLLSYEELEVEPVFLNVNNARKLVNLKIDRKSDTTTKDQVLGFAKERLPGFEWPTRTLKSGARKGLVIPADCCYDIADAYVIALAGAACE